MSVGLGFTVWNSTPLGEVNLSLRSANAARLMPGLSEPSQECESAGGGIALGNQSRWWREAAKVNCQS